MKTIALILFAVACHLVCEAQVQQHRYLRHGDSEYESSKFGEAEDNYRKANSLRKSFRGAYNLGNSVYQQERYEEAIKQYEEALAGSASPEALARAYHNLGNAYYNHETYDKSVDAYKNALRYMPDDWDTKRNLVMAMNKLVQQQQQQQREQNKGEQDNDSDQQQDPQQGESSSSVSSEDTQEVDNNELTKQDAEELLKIVEREDQRVQEKLKKSAGDRKKPEKDW